VCGFCFNPGTHSLTKANSLWVVANKQRPLNPITYKPALGYFKGVAVAKVAATAMTQMAAGMAKAKAGTLLLNSGYRSYDTQKIVHARQVARLGLKAGEALAARPGYSEHQGRQVVGGKRLAVWIRTALSGRPDQGHRLSVRAMALQVRRCSAGNRIEVAEHRDSREVLAVASSS
jgi:hypothetical protein